MSNISNNIKKEELYNNLKLSIISIKYNYNFYNFCYNYNYISNNNNYNLLNIYYNLYLVIKKCRFSFLIVDTDYPDLKIAVDIINKIKKYRKKYNIEIMKKKTDINSILYFILLKKNINIFNKKYSKFSEPVIGQLLSYPYYNHPWNNKFISFNVVDENGEHDLFANWYNPKIDNKIKFIKIVSKWIDILEKLNIEITLKFKSNFFEKL